MRRPWLAGGLILALGACGAVSGSGGPASEPVGPKVAEREREALQDSLSKALEVRQQLEEQKARLEGAARELDEAIARAKRALARRRDGAKWLEKAFGAGSPELSRPIQIELGKRAVIAAEQFEVCADGGPRLTTFSLALFGKAGAGGRDGEVVTCRARQAHLVFDRPVSGVGDLGACNLVEVALTGAASLTGGDGREVRADALKVRLAAEQGAKRARWPADLEATGNVAARWAGVDVHDAEKLVVRFKGDPAAKAGHRAPIHLSARSVELGVLRGASEDALDGAHAEGNVHALQGDTDVTGNELDLGPRLEGNVLVVRGDLAQFRSGKFYLLGPEIHVDQATNSAWADGPGAMQIECGTDLQGAPLKRPLPLTVHWSERMFFIGEWAGIEGGVQAAQGNARLHCQRMWIEFDNPHSFARGQGSDRPAGVHDFWCDGAVRIQRRETEGDRTVQFRRIDVPNLYLAAVGTTAAVGKAAHLSGPGSARIWQREGKVNPDAGQLTYVVFDKRMDANSPKNTAHFWENVRVLNLPSDRPNVPIDLDAILASPLPEGAMYLRCDRLKVFDQPESKGGAPNQQMEARGRVYVEGREFYARADAVFYNQAKDQVVLDGAAMLYKIGNSRRPEVIAGKKIIYNPSTGEARIDGPCRPPLPASAR
jgi:lipopolysaccharide export system protein LptA